jgi:hypothetical protein
LYADTYLLPLAEHAEALIVRSVDAAAQAQQSGLDSSGQARPATIAAAFKGAMGLISTMGTTMVGAFIGNSTASRRNRQRRRGRNGHWAWE